MKYILSIILAPVIFAFGGKIYCILINSEPCNPKQVQEEKKENKNEEKNEDED